LKKIKVVEKEKDKKEVKEEPVIQDTIKQPEFKLPTSDMPVYNKYEAKINPDDKLKILRY